MLTEDEINALPVMLLREAPGVRLGFLTGVVIAGLLRQGFSWDQIRAEFETAVDNAESDAYEPEGETSICEICMIEVPESSIAQACPECDLDGACEECMAEHVCEG